MENKNALGCYFCCRPQFRKPQLIIPRFLFKLQILCIKYRNVLQLHGYTCLCFAIFGIFLAFKWHTYDLLFTQMTERVMFELI